MKRAVFSILLISMLMQSGSFVLANGLGRNGIGATSMGLGGTAVANPDDSFAGLAVNPSLLGFLEDRDFSASVIGVVAHGRYEDSRGDSGFLDDNSGVVPELVIRIPWRENVGLGFSILPEYARKSDWVYDDLPGGLDGNTSYGRRHHSSTFVGVRTALGIGVKVSDTLSLGASVGVLYNKNELHAPYTFQSHPALRGAKTLLDLETDGLGINADFGVTWTPTESLVLGLAYRTPTRIESTGTARGDLRAQFDNIGFGAVPSQFSYEADVVNKIPDQVTFGGSLRISDRTTIASEIQWVRWSNGFESLPVILENGSNPSINGFLGSNGIADTVPLQWQDTVTYRVGIEHRLNEVWSLRAGYSYGKNPVPNETLLPMTAAISEHTISAGLSYERGPYEVSIAYQHDLPASETIGQSSIVSGEYNNSRVDLQARWVAISVKYDF